jgi:K+-sensing histidine kinase KdpD
MHPAREHGEPSRDTTLPRPYAALAVELTITQILRHPLLALRASMESLSNGMPAGDPRANVLQDALDGVRKLTDDVDALVDYTSTSPLRDRPCSASELCARAIASLNPEERARVTVAQPTGQTTLHTDPECVVHCLRRLLQAALAATDADVLCSVGVDEGEAAFTLVERDTTSSLTSPPAEPRILLGLDLAHRAAARMGGRIERNCSRLGNTCVRLRLPRENGVVPA